MTRLHPDDIAAIAKAVALGKTDASNEDEPAIDEAELTARARRIAERMRRARTR